MHTPTANHAVQTPISDRDAFLLRCSAAMFPAAYTIIGAWYAYGLLCGWHMLEGGTRLNVPGALIVAVQSVAAGAVTFGIVAEKQWRWQALNVWAGLFLVCGALFGMFRVPPEGVDRARLLAIGFGGAFITTTLTAFQLRAVERRLREGR